MKKLITILLGASFSLAGTAYAKPDKANKKSKAGPPQQVQQQSVNVPAGPKNKNKVKVHPVHPETPNYHSANVNPAKIQKKQLHEQEKALRKTNVQTNQLPAVQKHQKSIVNTQVNPANIEQYRTRYSNFNARRSNSIASVQFNQNYRIANAQNWTGPHYNVFRTYRPQWHDRSWWAASNFAASIVLIGGGYYYWDRGYWYPAWGYDTAHSYYPYDGPIYVGDNRVPFDRVLATVQASLQDQGYYRGEVDGLMGPLTREALANYQRDHGLIATAALDQPTLSSLGLG